MHFLVLLSALVACAAGVPFNTAKHALDERIVGGNPAQIDQHPHQVALLHFESLRCGGSIISPTCVVTAASCVKGIEPDDLTVRVGSTFHNNGGKIHSVTGGFYHGNFKEDNYDYDVAVLKVYPPFTYSDRVQSIALQDSEIPAGTNVVVTGWGSTSPNGPSNPNLLEAFVQITDKATCSASYSGAITDSMICTGTHSGYVGPCFGDGGGPLTTLYCPRELVGIVSWGVWDCAHPDFPAVYTKVSAVRNWIINLCSAQMIPKGITKVDAIP